MGGGGEKMGGEGGIGTNVLDSNLVQIFHKMLMGGDSSHNIVLTNTIY